MISGENLFSNLLTVAILFALVVLVYAKMANKTLVDIIRDLREAFSDKTEEVYDAMPNTFEGIR